jgi:hypothetical protein
MKVQKARMAGLMAAAGVACATGAAVGQNDRISDTPTGWIYLYGATSTQINTQLSAGFRPFAIENVGTGVYDAVFVNNAGSYNVPGATATFGRTPASMDTYLTSNNYRLLDLEVYDNGSGSTLMSAVVVPNSGASGTPAWGWLYNVPFSAIVTWMDDNPSLRLIDLDSYTINGTRYYSAVAVHNSGNNAQGWWYYSGVTASEISDSLTANGARLVSVELVSPGGIGNPATFACVMVSSNQGGGWWYSSLTTDQVSSLLAQNGARLTCLSRYTNFLGQTRWAAAMVDNSNDQTRRMRSYMGDDLPDGSYGFMLKQVGGGVLANLNENFAFEPASMIKILHATYATLRCSQGLDSLNNPIFIGDRCHPDECPDGAQCNAGNEALSVAMNHMLRNSDNNRTMEIQSRYGTATLNSFAASRGWTSTALNHRIGCLCGNPFNSFSCIDATNLYEQIADGSLFSSTWKDTLLGIMLNLDEYGFGIYPTLNGVIAQEAAQTNLTPTEISDFKAHMHMSNKGGGYACNGTFYRTDGAWAEVPFKTFFLGQPVILPREYTIATFFHGCTDDAASQIAYSAKEEILREQIRAALESWDSACVTAGFQAQPPNRSVSLGGSTTFPATVIGTPSAYDYQWQHRPVGSGVWFVVNNASGHISGATTTTLTLSNIVAADAGGYRLQVTSDCGAVNSNTATLTVGAPPCYANCDSSTISPVLNVLDFNCFLNRFAAGEAYANCDGSTISPVLNVLDFNCFLNQFAAGCP